jgi:hypothetical protein
VDDHPARGRLGAGWDAAAEPGLEGYARGDERGPPVAVPRGGSRAARPLPGRPGHRALDETGQDKKGK